MAKSALLNPDHFRLGKTTMSQVVKDIKAVNDMLLSKQKAKSRDVVTDTPAETGVSNLVHENHSRGKDIQVIEYTTLDSLS